MCTKLMFYHKHQMKSYYATAQRNYLVRKLLCSEKLGENSFNHFITTATTIYYYILCSTSGLQ